MAVPIKNLNQTALKTHHVIWKAAGLCVTLGLASCSSVPLTESGSLTSYNSLGVSQGRFTKSRSYADTPALLASASVAISPTRLSPQAYSRVHNNGDSRLVSNALDRALCIGLSDRYRVVGPGEPADITVKVVITDIVPTGKFAAGLSTAVSLGSSVVLPVGVPRLPIGLGGLAVEAEAIDKDGIQRAAIVWSRGANSITNEARVSEVGDAYSLASSFAGQFADMLAKGKTTSGLNLSLPSRQKLQSQLGGAPKNAACEAYGRSPGIPGLALGLLGAPPSWADHGAKL